MFSLWRCLSLALQQCREPKRGLAFLASPRVDTQVTVMNFSIFHTSQGSVSGGQSQPNPSCSRLNPPDHSAHHFEFTPDQIRSDPGSLDYIHTYYIITIRISKLLTIETTHEKINFTKNTHRTTRKYPLTLQNRN